MMDTTVTGNVNEADSVVVVAMDANGKTWSHAEWEVPFPGVVAALAVAEAIAHFGNMEITVVVKYMRA